MAHPALGFRVWFRGENIETAIDLKRVRVDNLGMELFRELDYQRCLANGGWTNQEEKIVHPISCRASL